MQKIGDVIGSQANIKGEFDELSDDNSGTIVKAAWLNTIQRELVAIVEEFGGTLNPDDDTQIAKILDHITPFDAPQNVKGLTPKPNALFFPEILTPEHTLRIFDNGNGTCGIGGNQWFLWRNIWKFNTSDYTPAERTLPMQPNQTYHARWRQTDGFSIHALTDPEYNPQDFPEAHPSFDSSYDTMLLAKIQSDENNRASITPLVNQHLLQATWETPTISSTNTDEDKRYFELEPQASFPVNWARTPYPFRDRSNTGNFLYK